MYEELYKRVAAWNAARYDQIYNNELTVALLMEEFNETNEAESKVDTVDGHLDTMYVALGGIWKLGLTEEELQETSQYSGFSVEQAILAGLTDFSTAVAMNIAALQNPDISLTKLQIASVLFAIVFYNHLSLEYAGFDKNDVRRAFLIVCDSNDSKTATKTDPSIKANINKGADFVDPGLQLAKLINEVEARQIEGGDNAVVH